MPEQEHQIVASHYTGFRVKNRYRIERELARGGFAIVYLAYDEQLSSKPVVIKVLSGHSEDAEWFAKKFREEREALARIDHPGVIGVLDCGEMPDGQPFLVMQFVDGITLRAALAQQPLSLERIARLVRQIAQALGAAHDRGVYHRDLKPDNIMLQNLGGGEELVKIIDFGIATVKGRLSAAPGVTRVVGSGPYMSPEHLIGKPTERSDTYSLGVIAYEMIAGQRPFDPESLAHLHLLQREGVKIKPSQLRPEVPPAADQAILKALCFEPGERQARVRDFGEELAGALTSRPTRTATAPAAGQAALEMAHVLFLDVVGYSLLPMEKQTSLLQQLQTLVQSTEEFRRTGNDLLSLPTGDGMALVFFRDPAAPARCALQLARALKPHPEIRLRMGIHSGPVYRMADINANLNVSGGGINMAQRVMDCGEAGHILLSRSTAEVLSQLDEWAPCLRDLGEHPVKHGVRVRIFNLYTEEAGNRSLPRKLRPVRQWRRAAIVACIVVLAGLLWAAARKFAFPVSAPAAPERAFTYSIVVQKYRDAKPFGQPFRLAGEINFEPDYRIRMLFRSSQNGRLYILNEGPADAGGAPTLNVLFPGVKESSEVAANQPVQIPSGEDWMRFDAQQGTETLLVVWSREAAPELEAARAFATPQYGGAIRDAARLQSIRAFLKEHRRPGITKEKGSEYTRIRGAGPVLVSVLPLEHH